MVSQAGSGGIGKKGAAGTGLYPAAAACTAGGGADAEAGPDD